MRWLIKTNIVVFSLVLFVSILPLDTFSIGRIARSIIELIALFALPGINIVVISWYFSRKNFSLHETLTLSVAASLFLVPLLLSIEFSLFKTISPFLPLFNSILIFLALVGISLYQFSNAKKETSPQNFSLNSSFIRSLFFSKSFLFSFVLYGAVAIGIVTAFYPLPDLDPYYWYTEFQKLFSEEKLIEFSGHRPLFSALVYILTIGAHIDFYAYFKYVLPFLFLSLLFPFSLLASQFRRSLHQAIFLLFPFINGINIIYLTIPIPQAMASIASFFAAALITCAWIQKSNFFFFVGGAVLCLGYWYHEILILPITMFALTAGFYFRRELYVLVRSHTLSTILCVMLILPYLFAPIQFVVSKIQTQLPLLAEFRTNLLFPQHYVNIDGNEMGWGDLVGISKYYSFYMGPALFAILCALFLKRKHIFRSHVLFSKYSAPLTVSFLLFFALAEILPRFFSIALLPDRAWVFAGAFALVFVPPILKTSLGREKLFLWILIAGFSLNIGAAIYINTLKKYTITEYQLVSAQWIKDNLPENRTILSSDHKRLLQFYSGSEVISITDPNFFYDTSLFEREMKKYDHDKEYALHAYEREMEQARNTLDQIKTKSLEKDISDIESLMEKISSSLSSSRLFLREFSDMTQTETSKNFYVYYAAPDSRNPYLDRPYMKKIIGRERDLIFNKNPKRFHRVYADEEHDIYLWEIL